MSGFHEIMSQIIEANNKKVEKMIITSGVVKHLEETTCNVSREGMPDLLGVRLHSAVQSPGHFIRITPKEGSTVLCGIIENDISEAVMLSYGDIEKITIKIEGAEFQIHQGKFTIKNQGADLKEILSNSFDRLTQAIIPTPSGPGSFSPNDKTFFQEQKAKTLNLFE